MDTADKIAKRALANGSMKLQDDRPQLSTENKRAMLTMWVAMSDFFGHSWTSQYGTTEKPTFETWSLALADFSPEQIGRGVNYAADPDHWPGSFPPNLAEFKRLCLTARYTTKSHQPFQIEHKTNRASKQTIHKEFQIMNRIVSSGFTETREQAMRALGLKS